ncbi:hypothetical protein CLMAG_48390 [Clostridium magnum DSM 2767]|uniref:Uncharacterized protein n=1 Tax=Clostridium magnum DSM 2767 TaxID=1121326 RepID=A0A162RFK5_9CLOT|nr:hypothetical protein CLMAG_48390 [Clostridium magnum DSM 2767]
MIFGVYYKKSNILTKGEDNLLNSHIRKIF